MERDSVAFVLSFTVNKKKEPFQKISMMVKVFPPPSILGIWEMAYEDHPTYYSAC